MNFFDIVKKNGRNIVRYVTSPVNTVSIAFHTKMGFEIEKNGDKEMNGISVYTIMMDQIKIEFYL
ncbi:hypothetical protein PspKH34_28890 [Parageobacillus sp. KH3-4]|nr:hypothetical protein PspKH34_28890 [Parageobacillus sp. KH3-4]